MVDDAASDEYYRPNELVQLLTAASSTVGGEDEVLQQATRVAEFFREFADGLNSVAPSLAPPDASVLEAGERIDAAVGLLGKSAAVVVQQDGQISKAIRATLETAARDLETALRDWIAARKQTLEPNELALLNVLSVLEERLDARRIVGEAQDARDEAVRVLETTRRAAGITGSTSLGDHFHAYGAREARTADRLRWACVLTLVSITILAGVLLGPLASEGISAAEELARLSLTIPLAVLAAYLGREATRHRSAARWARELEVQLLTVDAYTEPLSPELRDAIRSEFGSRVFSSGAPLLSDAPSDAPSVVGETAGLLEKLGGVLRSSQR